MSELYFDISDIFRKERKFVIIVIENFLKMQYLLQGPSVTLSMLIEVTTVFSFGLVSLHNSFL